MSWLKLLLLFLLWAVLTLVIVVAARAETGEASWYGPGLYGNRTACGQVLTTNTWGVAHRWLPCGTRLTVCSRRCVGVTVIDRGPYAGGRVLDLTFPVKQAIGMGDLGRVRWWRR